MYDYIIIRFCYWSHLTLNENPHYPYWYFTVIVKNVETAIEHIREYIEAESELYIDNPEEYPEVKDINIAVEVNLKLIPNDLEIDEENGTEIEFNGLPILNSVFIQGADVWNIAPPNYTKFIKE